MDTHSFVYCYKSCAFTQRAEIFGVITDANNEEKLPGAAVLVEGTSMGTISNNIGEFRLTNLTPGIYSFMVSYIGYEPQEVKVELKPGDSRELNFSLAHDAFDMEEVVVTAQVLGQARAINQQLRSDAIVNVVSSDKMKELPDVNAAEAIGRLPGISVQRTGGEASKVIVRGLSPKLTSVTINGVKLPSSSSTDRSVSLTNISPEQLSSVEVFKSPTADMDGDAIGGIVNLGIMKAPENPVATVTAYGGYSGLDKELGNYKGAFDLSNRYLDKKLGIYLKGNYESMNRSSEDISLTYFREADPFQITKVSLSDNYRKIARLGSNFGMDYRYESGSISGQGIFSQRRQDLTNTSNTLDESTLIKHGARHTESNYTTWQALLNGKQRVSLFEIDYTLGSSKVKGDNHYDVSLIFSEPNGQYIDTTANTIEEKLDFRTYNHSAAYLENYSWEPDLMEHVNYTAAVDISMDYSLGNMLSGFLKFGGKYRIDDRKNTIAYREVWDYYLDANRSLRGVENMLPDYVFETNDMGRVLMDNFIQSEEMGIWDDQYTVSPVVNTNMLDLWHERNLKETVLQFTEPYRNYSVNEKVTAFYLMTKIKMGNWFSFIPGIRFEQSDNTYTGSQSSLSRSGGGMGIDTTSYQKYSVLLPSAHLKIQPYQWFDIRMSAAKTIARPDYNMVTPRARIDIENGIIYMGNPELDFAEAWNYDMVLSFFSNKLGLFTLGGFYKSFNNYFTKSDGFMTEEQAAENGYGGGPYDVKETYINFDDSEVYGFEADLQTNFSFLRPPFNGIVVNANVTKLWSTTYNPLFHKVETYNPALRRTVVDLEKSYTEYVEVRLPDQTDWTYNFAIGYDIKGFSSRLSMIYQSAYLRGLKSSGQQVDDVDLEKSYSYTSDYLRFDLSLSQKIGKQMKLMFRWANLSNEGEGTYQYLSRYPRSMKKYGMTIDLGLQYKIL